MNGTELRTLVSRIFPNYSVGEDNDGQLIIYTNMTETSNDVFEEIPESL